MKKTDQKYMQFIFAYEKHFNDMPAMSELAKQWNFSRQRAHAIFKRLLNQNVLRKNEKDEYEVNKHSMSQFAKDIYAATNENTFPALYPKKDENNV